MPDDISTGRRTVAIFDVLGVKQHILSGKSEDLIRRYRERVSVVEHIRQAEHPSSDDPRLFPVGWRRRLLPSLHIFSDTVILIASDETRDATTAVLVESWRVCQSFMTGRLPVRGAITHDEMLIDSSDRFHVGLALTNAHLLEQSQAWAGCVVDESVLNTLPANPWPGFELIFPWYDVPFKNGSGIEFRRQRAVNWRCNLVFDVGFATDFQAAYGVECFEDLHPYLQRALSFGKEHRQYPQPELMPIECRVLWVGKSQPPFSNGDDY